MLKACSILSAMSTYDNILSAARDLFSIHGFEGASLRDICDQAGVAPSAVNYHFTNKQGLYDAVLTQFNANYKSLIGNLLDEPTSVETFRLRLALFIDAITVAILDDEALYKHITYEMEREPCRLSKSLQKELFHLFEIIMRYFEQAKQNGLIKEHIEIETLTSLVTNHIHGALKGNCIKVRFLNQSLHNSDYRKKWIENTLNIIFYGVVEPTGA